MTNAKRVTLLTCGQLFICIATLAQERKTEQPASGQAQGQLVNSTDGVVLYKTYCANCHGIDGKGFGPMAAWLKIKAPDLTRLSIREGGKFPLARVQRVISGEEDITAGHGAREMPLWGPVFSQVGKDQDLGRLRVYNVAKFLEQMQQR